MLIDRLFFPAMERTARDIYLARNYRRLFSFATITIFRSFAEEKVQAQRVEHLRNSDLSITRFYLVTNF